MTLQELLDARMNRVANMRAVLDKAAKENRELTAQEQTECDGWEAEIKSFNDKISAAKKNTERSSWLADQEKLSDMKVSDRKSKLELGDKAQSEKITSWSPLKDQENNRFARYNERHMRYSASRGSEEYTKAFEKYLERGDRSGFYAGSIDPSQFMGDRSQTLQSDDDPKGGYLVSSETFMEGLLKAVDDATWIWRNSRVIAVRSAQSLGIRKLNSKMSTWAKGAELSNAFDNIDTSLSFGKKVLTPNYFTGSARISRDLIRSSVMDIEGLISSEFARDMGYAVEQEDISGDGVAGPLGVLVNSTDGISSTRDYSTDTTATAFKVETLIGAKYELKPQYRNRARWMFNKSKIAALMKLRSDSGAGSGTGDFLWQPAVRAGEPDTICGLPVDENEFFPTATGSGTYFGLLAVWEYYVHAIALDMEILRLDQTRAHLNQIEYVGRAKVDGMPILEEAFVRLKYA